MGNTDDEAKKYATIYRRLRKMINTQPFDAERFQRSLEGAVKKEFPIDYRHILQWAMAEYDPCTLLHEAAAQNNVEAIDILVKAGAETEIRTEWGSHRGGWTALMIAIKENNIDAIKRLIELGADINTRNNIGNTPLMVALELSRIDAVKLLLDTAEHRHGLYAERGYSGNFLAECINAANIYDRNVLFLAVDHGHCDIVERLLNLGVRDIDGLQQRSLHNNMLTALDRACERYCLWGKSSELKIIDLLLDAGADPHTIDVWWENRDASWSCDIQQETYDQLRAYIESYLELKAQREAEIEQDYALWDR